MLYTGCTALDVLLTHLFHPVAGVRLTAALCVRELAVSVPAQYSSMLDRALAAIPQLALANSPLAQAPAALDGTHGFVALICALASAVACCPLGVPLSKLKVCSRVLQI